MSRDLDATPDLTTRILCSAGSLGAFWFLGGIGLALKVRDVQAALAFWIWSVPFFAAGWLLVGIPIILLANRLLRLSPIIIGSAGAAGGPIIMLLPWAILKILSHGREHYVLDWEYLRGWPLFGGLLGAGGAILYRFFYMQSLRRSG
jgi:hypothetical protein